jgi:PAS domain S-box-containing protein
MATAVRSQAAADDEAEQRRQPDAREPDARERLAALQRIVDADAMPIFSLDREYRYTSFNQAHAGVMKALYGADLELGHSLYEYQTVPEDQSRSRPNLDRALRGEPFTEEAFSGGDALSRRCFAVTHSPLRDDVGDVVGVAVFARDVTERAQAEEALRVSEARYRSLFENAQVGMFRLDLDGVAFLDVNPALARMFGTSREELLRAPMSQRWADPRAAAEAMDLVRARGALDDHELDFLTSTGERRTCVASFHRCPEKTYLEGMMLDITPRKRAEDALRDARSELTAIVDHAPIHLVLLDEELRICSGNRTFSALSGRPIEQLVGLRPGEALRCAHVEEHPLGCGFGPNCGRCDLRSAVSDTFATSKSHEKIAATMSLSGPAGTREARFLASTTAFTRAAKAYVLLCLEDVSERARIEEERVALEQQLRASRKMEAIGRLAGGIAHDFNNMLTVILSFTGFVESAVEEGSPARDDLAQIRGAAERAAALTHQLLAFSRRQVLELTVVDLNDVVTGLNGMLGRLIGEDVELAVFLAPELWSVKVDAGQLEQVIMNLAVNARDAMPVGGTLTIETSNVTFAARRALADDASIPPGSYVRLAVTDTGAGIDAATQARLFEPFFTTKEKGQGTGLGLATVYGIVTQCGGHIGVESEPGVGTTFTIHLPREEGAVAARAALAPRASAHPPGRGTVLVVEDEDAVRQLAKRILQNAGYDVLVAASGLEALALLEARTDKVDLLLTDVVLPHMSGRELGERLAIDRPDLAVLFMSGYTDDTMVRHGVLEGRTNLLGKPFTASELLRRVGSLIAATAPAGATL